MKFTFFHNTPAWYRFFLSVFVILTFTVISYLLAILISIPFFHLSFKDFTDMLSYGPPPDNIPLLKYFQAVQSFGTFFLPAVFLAWLFSGNAFRYLKFSKSISASSLILVALSVLVAIPLINFSGYLNSRIVFPDSLHKVEEIIQKMEKSYMDLLTSFFNISSIRGYIFNLFIIAMLPALCEEVLFRGLFQRLFIDWTKSRHIGIILTAAFFSIVHLHFTGLAPRFLLGVYFGYLLLWSNTLWLPVLAHFVNNAFAVTVYHFSRESPGNTVVDNIGNSENNFLPLLVSIFFFTIFTLSIYLTERIRQLRN